MNRHLLLYLLILLCNPVIAQVAWIRIPTPNESITSISTTTTTIYAGTSTYGVFKSTNEGTTWTNISLGLPDSLISGLQTTIDDKLIAATGSHGIYQYNGTTWLAINNGLPATNLQPYNFARATNGNIYMLTITGKIFVWNGAIWNEITFNFPALGRAIAIGPGDNIYAAAFAAGVYKFDGINTWTIVGAPMSNNFVTKLTVSNSDTIYVACNSNNVFRCPAAGGTWTSINTGLPAANMNFIGTDAQNKPFISTSSSYGALYRFATATTSWSLVTPNIYSTAFYCFAISPSGKIYAGAAGVFKSTDGGDSWNDMNPGMDAPKSILAFTSTKAGAMFVGTRVGPWRSMDNGNTWQLTNTGIAHLNIYQILDNAAGDIICHGFNNTPKGAIYRSTNNGDAWTQVAANGCDMYEKIKQHKSDTLWAASRFSGATSLSYSINNGANWINNPLKISAIWDIDFPKEYTIMVGSESEGVSRSDNGGQSFTLGVGNTIPWYGNVITIETDVNGVIFAGGDWWMNSLWFSLPDENGNNWTKFNDPDLVVSGVQDIVFDEHNNVYAAIERGGVRMAYNSVWNANTDWIPSSAGLPSAAVDVLDFSFDNMGYLYAVCYSGNGHDGGVFRSTLAVNPPSSSTYTFIGNGNWDVASNWKNNSKPPAVLSGNAMILIDPPVNGECVLNVAQQVVNGAVMKVAAGKRFRVVGNLNIGQ